MAIINNKIYALYNGLDADNFIAVGTLDEIAESTGIRKIDLHHYKKPSYRKPVQGQRRPYMYLVEVEED